MLRKRFYTSVNTTRGVVVVVVLDGNVQSTKTFCRDGQMNFSRSVSLKRNSEQTFFPKIRNEEKVSKIDKVQHTTKYSDIDMKVEQCNIMVCADRQTDRQTDSFDGKREEVT